MTLNGSRYDVQRFTVSDVGMNLFPRNEETIVCLPFHQIAQARAYALLAFLGGLSFVLFALARSDPSGRVLGAWAIVSVLALATHYFAAFLVFAEAVLILQAHRGSVRVRQALLGVTLAAVALFSLGALQTTRDSEPPGSFRPPSGFELASTKRVQHFAVLEYRSDDAVEVEPGELTGGAPQTTADLRVLVAR